VCAVTVKVKELILVAVEAMHCLGEGNETTQSAMIGAGHFDPIIKILTQTRYQTVQVRAPATVRLLYSIDYSKQSTEKLF